jgi:hypothetical protein
MKFADVIELFDLVQSLNHDDCCSSTAITNGSHTIFSGLKLVEQSGQNTRTGAAERVAERDSSTERVDASILKTENLFLISIALVAGRMTRQNIPFHWP